MRGKRPEIVFRSVRVDTDQPGREVLSLLDGVKAVVDPGTVRILRRESVFLGHPLHFHEGPAGIGLFRPDVVESLHDALEGLLEGLPRDLSDIPLQGGDGEGVPGHMIQIIGRKRGLVIEIPHARDGHVSDGIVVRAGLLVRAVHPLVPVTPVAVVEGEVVVVQEVSVTPAAGGRKGRFRHDSVSFQERRRRIEGAYRTGPHFAHEEVDPSERTPVGQLHLCHMARLVGGELRHPREGEGAVRFGMGIEVHPFRRPGHGAVGIGIMGMQDNRCPAPLQASRRHPGALSRQRPPFFQVDGIGPRQRVHPLRIDDAEMFRSDGGPAAERVGPVLVELGRCGRPGQEAGGEEEGAEHLHTTKLTIFA